MGDVTPILFRINGTPLSVASERDLKSLRPIFFYKLPYATARLGHVTTDLNVLFEYFLFPPFQVSLIGLNSAQDGTLSFELSSDEVLIYALIEGDDLVFKEADTLLGTTPVELFQIVATQAGEFKTAYKAGKNLLFVIRVHDKWLCRFSAFEVAQQSHKSYYGKKMRFEPLFSCKLDDEIKALLLSIYSFKSSNLGEIDAHLRMCLSKIIERCNEIFIDQRDLAEDVKRFIDENFLDKRMSLKFISQRFYVSERSVRDKFKIRYKENISSYIFKLRMEFADILLADGLKQKDVYNIVSYSTISGFNRALNTYRKYKITIFGKFD